jgi:hypothetical protein
MSSNSISVPLKRIVVPYVTTWSAEQDLPAHVIERRGFGIAYADEILTDRDTRGVLWHRTFSRPHEGRPKFGDVHSLRQRRAMRRLLCQVCGGPADRTEDGVLWLLPDHSDDWDNWPEGMANVEPPICLPCVGTSLQLCPKLRRGAAAVRVRESPVVGVRGALYKRGAVGPVVVGETVAGFDDPVIRWVKAVGLVRQMRGCSVLPLEEVRGR